LLIYYLWWNKPLDIEEPEQISVETPDMLRIVALMCTASELDEGKLYQDRMKSSYEIRFNVNFDTTSGESWITRRSEKSLRAVERLPQFPDYDEGDYTPAGRDLQLSVSSENSLERAVPTTGGEDCRRLQLMENISGIRFHSKVLFADIELIERTGIRPYIDLALLDVRRWKLALQGPVGKALPKNSLTDRVRNLPRFNGSRQHWPLYLGFGATGLIYGGLHCLAWDTPFPTDLERLLWRLSSVTISSTGVLVILVFSWGIVPPVWEGPKMVFFRLWDFYEKICHLKWGHLFDHATYKRIYESLPTPWDKVFEKSVFCFVLALLVMLFCAKAMYDLSIVAFMLLYVVARVYLVVECFLNLAHLPDAAYLLPQWSQYVPHIA